MAEAPPTAPGAAEPLRPARRPLRVAASLAVCVAAGSALGLAALRGPAPVDSPAPLSEPEAPVPALGWPCDGGCASTAAASPRAPSGPATRIRIPRIRVDTSLAVLDVDRAGELTAPADFTQAGWYGGGPVPGDTGPAVIAGHLDSKTGPAVFSRVPELRPGDLIEVLRGADWVPFRVIASRRYAKDRFPTGAVYDPTPGPELRLVTCGGVFDRRDRHYRDNVVVFAVTNQPAEIIPSSMAG